jgi:hypothetical protein
MALALAAWEWYFYFHGDRTEETFGWFTPERVGFNLAWLAIVYLSFQLLSIPFALRSSRERFVGVLDGMASLLPLAITLIVIFGKPQRLATPERWEAALLLMFVAAIDLFGGYTFNLALSRRMTDVTAQTTA